MEENFMEWKIRGVEWKWNGRKLPVWNMEKSSSIPYHAQPMPITDPTYLLEVSVFLFRVSQNMSSY